MLSSSHKVLLQRLHVRATYKRALSQVVSSTRASAPPLHQAQQQQQLPPQPNHGGGKGSGAATNPTMAAGRAPPPFLQQPLPNPPRPPPTMVAPPPPPPAPQAQQQPLIGEEQAEEAVQVWGANDCQRVSLRALAEVGLGKRPCLSSMRDAESVRDPLSSLNVRLDHAGGQQHTPAVKGLLRMATFLHRELPIRFAKGIAFLDQLNMFREAPDLLQVRALYLQSFLDIVNSPCPTTPASEARFVAMLERVRERHADELLLVARGVYELRARLGMDVLENGTSYVDLHTQLDELHLKRIALRTLIGHYLGLHQAPRPDYVGIINVRTRLGDVIEVAATDARWICKQRFGGRAPEVEIVGAEGMELACVPESLYYLSMELIKNSLRAVAERYHAALDQGGEVPPIQVILTRDYSLADGQQIVIEVRDLGGGIPPQDLEKVFCYLFSTSADAELQQSIMGGRDGGVGRGLAAGERSSSGGGAKKSVPLAGLGYGLGIAKQYARYFGGSLEIVNRPGKGCSVFVTLSRLGECKEPLV